MDRSLRLGLLVLPMLAALGTAQVQAACPVRETDTSLKGKITKVSDGDTFRIQVGQKNFAVRMLSIDTPETNYNGMTQGHWGDMASNRLKALLPVGADVEIRLDAEKCDGYDRVLAYAYKGNENINETMLIEGLAVTYCIFPNISQCDRLSASVRRAIDARLGMFSDPRAELPYDFRRRVSNRPYEKWAGSLKTKAVLSPEKVNQIPVWERIFFMRKDDVAPPFFLARQEERP